jgi:hypothetical protein
LLLKGLTVEDAYAPEIASGAIRYDAAAGMLELWKEPDPIREAAEREASIIRHREGREILGVARDGRAAEDDAIDSAAAEAAMAASLAALRETRPIEHPMNYVPDAMLRGKRIYVATSKFEFERAVMAQECAIEWMKTHPNDPYFEAMSGIESARVVFHKPCYERHVSMANWNPNYSPR